MVSVSCFTSTTGVFVLPASPPSPPHTHTHKNSKKKIPPVGYLAFSIWVPARGCPKSWTLKPIETLSKSCCCQEWALFLKIWSDLSISLRVLLFPCWIWSQWAMDWSLDAMTMTWDFHSSLTSNSAVTKCVSRKQWDSVVNISSQIFEKSVLSWQQKLWLSLELASPGLWTASCLDSDTERQTANQEDRWEVAAWDTNIPFVQLAPDMPFAESDNILIFKPGHIILVTNIFGISHPLYCVFLGGDKASKPFGILELCILTFPVP